jgi:MscS family membrane protein
MLRHTPILVALLALALLWPAATLAAPPTHLPDKEEPQINAGLDPLPKEATLDRSTPRRSWSAFLDGCRQGRWELAAHLLNLGEIPSADQKTVGAVVARNLCEVLKKAGKMSAEGVDDSTLGPIAEDKPTNYVVVATIALPEGQGEVWWRRFKDGKTQQHLWLATRRTVSEVPRLHQLVVKGGPAKRKAVELVNQGLGRLPDGIVLTTPRDTATLFAKLTSEGNFAEAARLLNLSATPAQRQATEGKRLARRLTMILKRIHPGAYGRMSNDPMGSPEKDVPFDEEVVARTKVEGAEVQVRLARVVRSEGPAVWVFSPTTVADIDTLYTSLGYGWAGDYLPPLFFEWQMWQIQLWQWLGLVVALILGLIFGYIGSYIMRKVLLRLAKLTKWDWDDDLVATMRGPLVGAFWSLGFVVLIAFLALAPKPHGFLLGLCKLMAILALGWFLLRLMDVAATQLQRMFRDRGDDMGMAMVPVARKILKPIMFVIVLIVALQNIGVDVSGLLAGLGIGGLAFALAAKDTLANVFGSVAIAFDRPFKVGDFVKVGDILGTVEDVGLRTTRVRTLDRTVISVPNSQIADSKIENYAPRDRVRLVATLGVQYDTSLDQLRYIVDEFKRYLLAHPRWWQESFRVRFIGYGASSLDIEVYGYVSTSDFNEFTAIREEILMGLGDIIERAGAEFAYPSQTVYVGKDSQADPQKAKQAATIVAQRAEAGELCIPEIPDALREKVLGPQP